MMTQGQATSPNGGKFSREWAAPFFFIWTGQAFSLLGSMIVQFALVWWITKTTGSATILATATLIAMLPGIVVGPVAGALVDRWNRKRVMIVADGAVALLTLGLIYLYSIGALQVWHIFVVSFLRGVGGSFHFPAMQASTSLMVPKEQLSRVAGMNQTLNGAMNIISPPLAALLIGLMPLNAVLMIDVATATIAITCLFFVHIPQPVRQPAATPSGQQSVLADVRDGFRYMWSWPGLFAMMIIAALINFLISPAFALMPILVTKHFGGNAFQLGGLESLWGFGVLAGGLLLSVWGGFRRRMLTSLTALMGMGLGIFIIGLAPGSAFWVALVGMGLAGFMNPVCNGPIFAILQDVVAPDMQGRVFTVVGSVSGAMTPLSLLVAGPISDAIGVNIWYVVGGLGCISLGALALAWPATFYLEDHHKKVATAAMVAAVVEAAAMTAVNREDVVVPASVDL
jgi:DHA3 family macrolide efflux protein-like MFS transporter